MAALLVPAATLQGGWKENLTSDSAGPFPPIRPFEAEFRIGWSEIEAGEARVKMTGASDRMRLEGSGGTTGMARMLWQLDATLAATSSKPNFETIYSMQIENYASRKIETQIVRRPDGIWRLRENIPPGENPARWKKIKLAPLRDLFSGMLFIRSKPLARGETVSTVIFPGDSPFFVEMKSLGTETIQIAGSPRDAIKLDIKIHRINLKKGDTLEAHGKFRSGTVWLSNDADRLPLRAEVDIFIGYVFAELKTVTFLPR
jgi:hypothetical protein